MNLHAVRSEICSLIHELWLLKGYGSDFFSQLKKHQLLFIVEQVSDEAYRISSCSRFADKKKKFCFVAQV